MDNSTRKRAPPIAAIYAFRRSNTMPICRITGKSHSMDDHHYVPCMDDFPKFDRLSGCRITEKHQYFKDYKYAYPIIDLDGTTRMVTEHDFHCRITAKYRAMAGHKYLYPVLGATTDKTVDDMVSVVEEESMRDVLIPTEVEMIVKGGVEDVLKMKEGEYLFIYSKEGTIIPAATKEIRGKGSTKQGRRHTLPADLEAGAASDLEEFRRSLRVKMLSEIRNPPADPPPVTEVFDKIQEEVEVLKDVRKSRPKRPGKHTHRGSEGNQKRVKREEKMAQKENTIEESKEEDLPTPKLSRMERYKMQFSAFESSNSNKDSGNRLTLVGAFDENEVVELDFGEPMSIEITEIEPTRCSAAIISDDEVFKSDISTSSSNVEKISTSLNIAAAAAHTDVNESAFTSVKETLYQSVTTADNQNGSKTESILKTTQNDGFQANNISSAIDSFVANGGDIVQKMVTSAETLTSNVSSKFDPTEIMQITSFEKQDATSDRYSCQNDENVKVYSTNKDISEMESAKNIHSQKDESHKSSNLLSSRKSADNQISKSINEQKKVVNGHDFVHEMMETKESLSSKNESYLDKMSSAKESIDASEPMHENESEEFIIPKKVSYIPQSNVSKSLMSELKAKLSSGPKKKIQEEKSDSKVSDSEISINKKDTSENILNQKRSKGEKINGFTTENQKTVHFSSNLTLESRDETIISLNKFIENGKDKINMDDFDKTSIQFQKGENKHKVFNTENGARDFNENSVVKKLKLDDQSNDTNSKVKLPSEKHTFSEDVSHAVDSRDIRTRNSEGMVSKISENKTSKITDLQNFKEDSLDFKKDNYSRTESNSIQKSTIVHDKTGEFGQSLSKKTEVSENEFNIKNSNLTNGTHLSLISETQNKSLCKSDEINSNISVKELKNGTEHSIDLDTEKCNKINVTHSVSKIATQNAVENDSSFKQSISSNISLSGTSKSEFSEQIDEFDAIKNQQDTLNASKSAETNKLKTSHSQLSDSIYTSQTLNETLIVNNLSSKESKICKESEQSSDKMKHDTHSQFPLSLDSNDPASKTECGKQSARHSDTQGLQKRLPVPHEITSEESSVGENIPLSISVDKKVEAETLENEKQCQVCKLLFLIFTGRGVVSLVTNTR
ncbi:uncharacterized protein NPIL_409881 [Nephila pilipes]|uniref:Uncharacterized protein n=1 Tax=Nephila pilipes TaxID=299642 RepID=A0A8X6MG61_NEPPI|nr:uncharacterized protein NPIL_409881 [Nephila pilipes]